MADKAERGKLRRKRRLLGREDRDGDDDVPKVSKAQPSYGFVHLAALMAEVQIPILLPGKARPRNAYNLLGSGGSFLVFKESSTMDDAVVQPDQIWSLADRFVLKRTRSQSLGPVTEAGRSAARYASIMAELQVFTHPSVREHENIIDFLGLTWDFEANADGSESVWPVLALEAAESTFETVLCEEHYLPLKSRLEYCHDISNALHFLHNANVAHCDIKAENVLICVSSLSSRNRMVAKISDFGSAVLEVGTETFLSSGIAGTPPWNAPEWRQELKGLDILKTDVYSFSMLVWRAVAPRGLFEGLTGDAVQRDNLISSLETTKLRDKIFELATEDINKADMDPKSSEQIIELLKSCFKLRPELRCGIQNLRSCLADMTTESEDEEEDSAEPTSRMPAEEGASDLETQRSESSDIQADYGGIQNTLLTPFTSEFDRVYELFEEESTAVKQQLFIALEACSKQNEELPYDAAEAAYQLSTCYVNGFGVNQSYEKGLEWSLKSARAGNLKAKADVHRLETALSIPSSPKMDAAELLQYLTETSSLGSAQAAADLKQVDNTAYEEAMINWSQRFGQVPKEQESRVLSESELLSEVQSRPENELNGAELNDRGHGFIHIAASLNYPRALDQLINLGVDIDKQNQFGENALLCACRAGNIDIALILLEHNATVAPTLSGETPLHWLISCDDDQVNVLAQALVLGGAELEAQHCFTESNEYNFDVYPHGTPLDWAVSQRKMSAISVLVELGADPFNDCSQYSPVIRAVSLHDTEVLELLFISKHATPERKRDFDSSGQTLLFHAVYCYTLYNRMIHHGSHFMNAAKNMIKTLLEHGCDPTCVNQENSSIMDVAAGFADREMVVLLLDEFGFSNILKKHRGPQKLSPLHHAIASRRLDVLEVVLLHGADPFAVWKGQTVLHSLAWMEDETFTIECFKILKVSTRPDMNKPAIQPEVPDGLTPFEIAVFCGHLRVADYLLTQGVDIDGPENHHPQFLSLMITEASWYSLPALDYFMKMAKPGLVVQSKNMLTALHVAASIQNLTADTTTAEAKLNILLRAFPQSDQVNAQTIGTAGAESGGGQTALHYAAKFGSYFSVRSLLEAGANVNLRDDEGCTALDLAQKHWRRVSDLVNELNLLGDPLENLHTEIREMQDLVLLLENAIAGRPPTDFRSRVLVDLDVQTRLSRMGFATDDP